MCQEVQSIQDVVLYDSQQLSGSDFNPLESPSPSPARSSFKSSSMNSLFGSLRGERSLPTNLSSGSQTVPSRRPVKLVRLRFVIFIPIFNLQHPQTHTPRTRPTTSQRTRCFTPTRVSSFLKGGGTCSTLSSHEVNTNLRKRGSLVDVGHKAQGQGVGLLHIFQAMWAHMEEHAH